MNNALTVALEFLKVGAKTELPMELVLLAAKFRDIYANTNDLPVHHGAEIAEVIKRLTGLTIDVTLCDFGPAIQTVIIPGHSGANARWGAKTEGYSNTKLMGQLQTSTIDLENVRVSGFFAEIPFMLYMPTDFYSPTSKFTDEEITATVLHEIGHAFFCLATLGEYVWLNYYLQDGVDVVLGRKPNIYKVEILNKSYLEKNLDDKSLVEAIQKQPTEANVRRALLQNMGVKARDHFNTRMGLGAFKRDEQLADLFATRLGYGKALVFALDKLYKQNPLFYKESHGRIYNMAVEAFKIAAMLLFSVVSPHALALLIITVFTSQFYQGSPYDIITERMLKVKRDLVNQLKQPGLLPSASLVILDDIKAVDEITKNMTQYRTTLELITQVLNPARRSDYQRLKLEEQLEQLMNNDLFAVSAKLNQHA